MRGIGRALVQDVAQPQGGPGRLDDRPAVRQERAARAVRPHGLPEAARGGAGLPPHAQVVEGARSSPSTSTRSTSATAPTAIESAARTYFGNQPDHQGCGTRERHLCVSELKPDEAALLAGVVATPSGLRPRRPPAGRPARGATSCSRTCSSRACSPLREYRDARIQAAPGADRHQAPHGEDRRRRTSRPGSASSSSTASAPAGRSRAACKVQTTLDLDLQQAAEQAVNQYLRQPGRPDGRRSSRSTTRPARCARWSAGATTTTRPFNLATQGQRQPGSSFKPFVLAAGAEAGHRAGLGVAVAQAASSRSRARAARRSSSSTTTRASTRARRRSPTALDATPTTRSSRRSASRSGTKKIAAAGRAHGHPHAGLHELRDDARRPQAGRHAARHGPRLRDASPRAARRITGTLGARDGRPGRDRTKVDLRTSGKKVAQATNQPRRARAVLPAGVADRDRRASCPTVIIARHRHARAALGRAFVAGKTGTTENYGDAWFVGFTEPLHGRRLGRLPRQAQADEDRVPRGAGRRAAPIPAADLARLHGRGQRDRRRPQRQGARAQGTAAQARPTRRRPPPRAPVDPDRRRRPARGRRRRAPARTTPTAAPPRRRAKAARHRRPARDAGTPRPRGAGTDDAAAGARPRPTPAGRRRDRRRRPAAAGGGTARAEPRRRSGGARAPGGHGRDTWRLPRRAEAPAAARRPW